MNIKNILGFFAFFFIQVVPWIVFLVGIWVESLYLIMCGGFYILYLKLHAMEGLLSSLTGAFLKIVDSSKEEADKIKKDNLENFR